MWFSRSFRAVWWLSGAIVASTARARRLDAMIAAGASLAAHGDAKKAAPGFPENTILGVSANRL